MTLDGRSILSGSARQRALTEYWNDPNNNRNIPGWASIRMADGNPSNDPDTVPLAQTLRAARQCAGGGCP